jgi:hypothetical protein
MLALVGTVLLRSASQKVLLRDGDKVLGTHRDGPGRAGGNQGPLDSYGQVLADPIGR